MTNHHKAFAKLQEFIQEVLAGQVALKEMETKRATVKKETEDLQAQREKLLKELPPLRAEWDSLMKKIRSL
jgi:FtsZ-binding cell division protein ZapB